MPNTSPEKKDINDNNITAAIGYIGILCFVPLLLVKKSKFAQFHARQGLMVFALEVVAIIIPPLAPFLIIIAVVLSILGIKASLEGKYWELPILGKYAKKINL